MSAAETRAVIDRLEETRRDIGAKEFAAYAFLALGLLSGHAPEAVAFILDQTDAAVGR